MSGAGGRILVVDIGGSSLKLFLEGAAEVRTAPTGPDFGPADAVRTIHATAGDWAYDRLTIGCPGPVRGGRVVGRPVNLGPGWVGFDFAAAFGRPVRLVNDAVLQTLGAARGGEGRTLFLGLGTGLGAALAAGPVVLGLELARLPWPTGGTWEDRLGARGLAANGRRVWREDLARAIAEARRVLLAEEVVLGGGNARLVGTPEEGCRLADGGEALRGGVRLWREAPMVL